MGVLAYVLRRIFIAIPVLLLISIITFTIAHSIPCDPLSLYLGGPEMIVRVTPEQRLAIEKKLGLDQPLYIQYIFWVERVFHGDLGISFRTNKPIIEDIKISMARSLELVHFAFFLTFTGGVLVGVACALKRNSRLDQVARIISLAGTSAPLFWVAILLQIFFYLFLKGVLPLRGMIDISLATTHPIQRITGMPLMDSLITGNVLAFASVSTHMILPAISLMMRSLARVIRQTRSSMLDVLTQDYVRTARAYGLPNRLIVFKYALRNALIPVITIMGNSYARLLMGTFLIEVVFDWPGIGLYSVMAFISADYPAILGVTLITSAVIVMVNLVVDVLYCFIDPRIKL